MKTLGNARVATGIGERLGRLTAETPRQWGTMSAGEAVCHLRGAFRVALGQETLPAVPSPMPPKLLKWLALRAPVRWPHGVPTVPGLERGTPLMATADFAADHAALMGVFAEFLATRELQTPHPMFGAMRTADWKRWGYLHTDHHLRQFGC